MCDDIFICVSDQQFRSDHQIFLGTTKLFYFGNTNNIQTTVIPTALTDVNEEAEK